MSTGNTLTDRPSGLLSPAQLIALTGTSRGILRVYERLGLIEAAERSTSGYRRYSNEAVDQLRAIRTAKELGFTLAEISEMLGIGAPGMSKVQVRALARKRVDLLDLRIAQLTALRDGFAEFADDPSRAFDPECDLLLGFVAAGNERVRKAARKR